MRISHSAVTFWSQLIALCEVYLYLFSLQEWATEFDQTFIETDTSPRLSPLFLKLFLDYLGILLKCAKRRLLNFALYYHTVIQTLIHIYMKSKDYSTNYIFHEIIYCICLIWVHFSKFKIHCLHISRKILNGRKILRFVHSMEKVIHMQPCCQLDLILVSAKY